MPEATESPRLEFKRDLLKLVVLAVPVYAVNWIVNRFGGELTGDRRWLFAAVALPLIIVVWVGWQILSGRSELLLRGKPLLFLVAYVTLFSIVARSDVFFEPREVIDSASEPPQRPRLWNGNWHYNFATAPAPLSPLQIVMMPMPTGQSLDEVRYELARIVATAKQHGAIGVGFDFYFDQEAPNVDSIFCDTVNGWPKAVAAGVNHVTDSNHRITVFAPVKTLLPCFHDDAVGHLGVLNDPDGVVRMIPHEMPGNPYYIALSSRIAKRISEQVPSAKLSIPESHLIEFVPSATTHKMTYAELTQQAWPVAGKYVLFGRDVPEEYFTTPFGRRLGAEIHAYGVQALLGGGAIRRPTWGWTVPTIFVSCYIIAVLFVARRRWYAIILAALGLSAAIGLSAIAAMKFGLVWLETGFPLIALWLFVGLFSLAARRLSTITAAAARPPSP